MATTNPRRRIKDRDEPEEVQLVLAALADPTRRWLLHELDTWTGVPISYLKQEVRMSRQALHKHLAVLAKAGIVIKSGGGAWRLYYMDPRPIRRVFAMLARRYKRDLTPLGNLYLYGAPVPQWD
jgi:DNA-binding transcriptional ArsR family regulator